LQVFYVSEVCSKSHWGTAQAPWEGVRRVRGRWMEHAARLGSYGQGVLVLILTPRSRLRPLGMPEWL
jgi:hypothetical protein